MEEIKSCICGICSNRCIMDITVSDGKIVRAAPRRGPGFEGCSKPCPRGACAADYEYRSDRILTPLRRIGARGEGKFEPISWDEALDLIAEKLLAVRAAHGADSVVFYTGYSKWYRPMFHRLAGSFGSVNYGTESSSCHHACVVASFCDTGLKSAPDYENAGILLTFARARLPKPAKTAHERGMKILVVDPRTSRDIADYADLHLRPRPGTDGALAHALANLLIASGCCDTAYIDQYVHGFDAYRSYVASFTPERAEALTGVPAEQIRAAAEMIAENLPLSIYDGFSGSIHHRNGVQNFRAWDALNAVTGCYGRKGGNRPVGRLLHDAYTPISFREHDFALPQPLDMTKKVGAKRFPVWNELINECQCMDFAEAARRGELRAIFALGMNARMFPDSNGFFEMLSRLDFYVDCDIWLSDSAKYADIVLPAATSYERDSVIRVGAKDKIWYSPRAVQPLGSARSDEDIICDLARRIAPDDTLLCAGKEDCWRWQLEGTGITLEQLKLRETPYPLPAAEPAPKPLETGFPTPTGKFELASEILAAHGYPSLPEYTDVFAGENTDAYPLTLMAGVRTDRYAHAFHTRVHTVSRLRAARPEAAVDLHPSDADALGLRRGDRAVLQTAFAAIEVAVDFDTDLLPGTVNMYQGYSEADVNTLLPPDWLDPISGFPGYKAIPCRIAKK